MSLSKLQQEFSAHLAELFTHIIDTGMTFTLGDSYRSQEQACINSLTISQRKQVEILLQAQFPELAAAIGGSTGVGINHSVHRLRLAQDLNLFKDGVYLTDPDPYKELGQWWKGQHPDARYGGDWNDDDHFSFEYQGVK